MNTAFNSSTEKRSAYLKNLLLSKDGFRKKSGLANFLRKLAVILLSVSGVVIIALFLSVHRISYTVLLAGFILSMIPYLIGNSVSAKAFREFGAPFLNRTRECLKVSDDSIEYLYHDASARFPESMDVYKIAPENITAVNYDRNLHIITITGAGELLSCEDSGKKEQNTPDSRKSFDKTASFSFLSSFENEEQAAELLKNKL